MEEIPSPFYETVDDKLLDLIEAVFKSHGYTDWQIVIGKENGGDNMKWYGASNSISDGMIDTIQILAEDMRTMLDKELE